MTQAAERHPSVTVYTPARLALYDLFILGFSCRFVWRCPKRHFLALYDRYASARHLDVGVGTGYFLDRCSFPAERPQLTLLDLSEACLSKASRRLSRYSPRLVRANVLEPLELGSARFRSVGLNGLLHCLPGTLETKAAVFQHLKPFVDEDEGVVFGSTILGHGVEHGRLARKALRLYNREGISRTSKTTSPASSAHLQTSSPSTVSRLAAPSPCSSRGAESRPGTRADWRLALESRHSVPERAQTRLAMASSTPSRGKPASDRSHSLEFRRRELAGRSSQKSLRASASTSKAVEDR